MDITIMVMPGSSSVTRATDVVADDFSTPGPWQPATVTAIREETASAKTFSLRLNHIAKHLAGQHYIIRLTAPDGYVASRSYSVASAPDDTPNIDITVELLPGGEVSTFLHDEVVPGDEIEVRGPIGGWFVWRGDTPALLIGGGSGVVPLMAMLRLARQQGSPDLVRLIVSVRTPRDLFYKQELLGPETTIIYTRESPGANGRPIGRLAEGDLAPIAMPKPMVYICGSSSFADSVTGLVIKSGIPTDQIRIERFGPSG